MHGALTALGTLAGAALLLGCSTENAYFRSGQDAESDARASSGGSGGAGAAGGASGGRAGGAAAGGASGGGTGSASAGGAGGSADSGTPAIPLTGTPIPELNVDPENCLVSALPDGALPPLRWVSCGPACEEADATAPLGGIVVGHAASMVESVALGAWRHGLRLPDGVREVWRIVRLRDGVSPTALVAHHLRSGGCTRSWDRQSANSLLFTATLSPTNLQVHGVFRPSRGWAWSSRPIPRDDTPPAFTYVASDQSIFYAGGGGVFYTTPPTPGFSATEGGEGASLADAYGDTVVWLAGDRAEVRASEGHGPAKTIAQAVPTSSTAVAVSADHVVGIAQEGAEGREGIRFWYHRRGAAPAAVEQGPTVGGGVFIGSGHTLRTWGDYAAAWVTGWDGVHYPEPPYPRIYQLIVVQLSTWKAWRLGPRDGFDPRDDTFAIDGEHLYAGAVKDLYANTDFLAKLYRFPLARLDEVAERLTP
ncbi:MAG: hypothetical protein FJ104_08595 [Deltaproteobacteria bacterium]|nr:hypothetical protein [Deltaproteobacteria bacterium]